MVIGLRCASDHHGGERGAEYSLNRRLGSAKGEKKCAVWEKVERKKARTTGNDETVPSP